MMTNPILSFFTQPDSNCFLSYGFKTLIGFLFIFLAVFQCNTLEKERLELDRQILEFEKERLKKCGCTCECTPKVVSYEVVEAEKKVLSNCTKVFPPSREDIWNLAEKGDWSYSPKLLSQKEICREDLKETFYKIYHNTESYVAETQVPKTKKSSCINNVLFYGKSNLYDSMIGSATRELNINEEKEKLIELKNKIIEYNTAEKGRSFYYECKPTDKEGAWNRCVCVLYA
ncbi:MAG: hypothetical protein N3A69_15095, partial [Leptospiraceae bacterium]|nr:hypothetical protein [Leptospiraceae bacterium]